MTPCPPRDGGGRGRGGLDGASGSWRRCVRGTLAGTTSCPRPEDGSAPSAGRHLPDMRRLLAPGALVPPRRDGRTARGRSRRLSSGQTVRGPTGLGTGGSLQAPWCGATAVVPMPTPSRSASPGCAQGGRRALGKNSTYGDCGAGSIPLLGPLSWGLRFPNRRSVPTRGPQRLLPRGHGGALAAAIGCKAASATASAPHRRTKCARPTRSVVRTQLPGYVHCGQGSRRGSWRRLRPAPRGAVSRARPPPARALLRHVDVHGY